MRAIALNAGAATAPVLDPVEPGRGSRRVIAHA
jgi:hypothetical protein